MSENIITAGDTYLSFNPKTIIGPQIIKAWLSKIMTSKMSYKSVSGILTTDIAEIQALMIANGGHFGYQQLEDTFYYFWEDSYVCFDFIKKTNDIVISSYFIDSRIFSMLEMIEKKYITKVKTNLIFSIVSGPGGLQIQSLGKGSSPLISENYNPEVLSDLEYVLDTFRKTPPPSRICILNGEPGSGKTFLIRSMLTQLDCVFLIVPSNLISSMDKPDFLPLLLRTKNDYDKPIIMVIEDGDACLAPRKSDNISMIASLLNLSDGILGSIIDVRMIISTNADIQEIDEAIMRPGRLCKQIHVGPLHYDQATKVYRRLMNDQTANLDHERPYTLAEIYGKFNNKDVVNTTPIQTPVVKRQIGFHSGRVVDENTFVNKKQ